MLLKCFKLSYCGKIEIDYVVSNPLERKPEKVIIKYAGTENTINKSEVAKMFNTHRALMTGTPEKCDIDDPIFVVDTKLRANWSVDKKYEELLVYARKHDKIPILCLRKSGKKRRLTVVDMDHLVSILKGKGLITDNE